MSLYDVPLSLTLVVALLIPISASARAAAAESVCHGLSGSSWGLCNAYCEGMDCDAAEHRASERACTHVLGKIDEALGYTPLPTCEDVDADGIPNGFDNCPDIPNTDQVDVMPENGVGDACEGPACPCLNDAVPVTVGPVPPTVSALIDDAADFASTQSPQGGWCLRAPFQVYQAGRLIIPFALWAFWIFPDLDDVGAVCYIDRIDIVGDSNIQRWFSRTENLTDYEFSGCQEVMAELQMADPFGECN